MTSETTRETMKAYADALLAFGDYARYLSDDVTMTFMGTDRAVKGRDVTRLGLSPGPFRLFLDGAILLAVILYLPNGLASLPQRFRRWRLA